MIPRMRECSGKKRTAPQGKRCGKTGEGEMVEGAVPATRPSVPQSGTTKAECSRARTSRGTAGRVAWVVEWRRCPLWHQALGASRYSALVVP
jgi:hypothetical protein